MRRISLIFVGAAMYAFSQTSATFLDGESQYQNYAPDGIPFVVSDSMWTADSCGNHRAVLTVAEQTTAIKAVLPWRRADLRPETKRIKVVCATTGKEIKNISVLELTAERGTIVFEPQCGAGTYYVYYMPYKYRKEHNDARYGKPWNDYLAPEYSADDSWLTKIKSLEMPTAKVERFESRSTFDFFTPMGTIATKQETDSLRNIHHTSPVVFLEDRAFPIRLTNNLPVRWIKKQNDIFEWQARPNEYYVWQVGVWASKEPANNIKLSFTDLTNGTYTIGKENITCFNQEGINWNGDSLKFEVNVPKDKVQALWCGVQVPEKAPSGIYSCKVIVSSDNCATQEFPVKIEVSGDALADNGDGELWRHSRLRWLNSTIGTDNHPVAPYKAMSISNKNQIIATDKKLTLSANGLPKAIEINNKKIISKPFEFIVEAENGDIKFNAKNLTVTQKDDGLVTWSASSTEKGIKFKCEAYMEYDGYVNYKVSVSSDQNISVRNIKLVNTYSKYASEYYMGTGYKGGTRPEKFTWDWKGPWDSYWIGNTLAGLHVEYRGGAYHGPLLNDYKPKAPASWSNEGKGTITESGDNGKEAIVAASTGSCSLTAEPKTFEFALLITPVKPLNPSKHFSERYYHSSSDDFDKAAIEGPNIANIHHAQKLNPFINYPFIVRDSLIDFINHEHEYGRKVKLYYTIRELTNHTTEIYALKSLNHEIFTAGVGYGLPWHTEHLIDDYKPAWYAYMPNETSDAALVLSGFSRWINYYLEGLRWMCENYKIDGIYMDDVSFDRNVMKRMRKILAEYRPGSLIDLHSNTGYSVGPANQYTDFFPYVDRLWFGESFQYNKMRPDEWMVTFSGIPFGVMSEMLQDGGNRYLGMVYGTTARHSYGKYSPAPVWALWKSFGIEDAKMVGYWDNTCPVKTDNDLVKATAYMKQNSVLISVGNFDNVDREVKLSVDWKSLNIDKSKAKVTTPAVKDFQEYGEYNLDNAITIKSKEGLLLLIEK